MSGFMRRGAAGLVLASIAALAGVNPWLLVLGLIAVAAFVAYVVERRQPRGKSVRQPAQRSAWNTFG